jgi:hypothetical protein
MVEKFLMELRLLNIMHMQKVRELLHLVFILMQRVILQLLVVKLHMQRVIMTHLYETKKNMLFLQQQAEKALTLKV